MKCIKCGAYVYSADKFCRNCGTTLQENDCKYGDNITNSKYDSSSCHEKQYNYNYNYSNKTQPTYNLNATHAEQYDYTQKYSFDSNKYAYVSNYSTTGDDKYIQAYVGNNYNIIKKQKFSIPALLFGIYYLLYRKVWGHAFVILLINIAATILLNENIAEIVGIILNIYIAFKFSEIYIKKAETHVERIKQENLDKTTEELLAICKKKGGTSFTGIIVLAIVWIIGIITLAIFLTAGNYIEVENIPQADETYKTEKRYSINYIIPEGFVLQETDEKTTYYSYVEQSTSTICRFSIRNEEVTKTENEYLLDNLIPSGPNETVSPPAPITYNQITWKYAHIESQYRSDTQYITRAGNQYFVIYTSDTKTNGETNTICNQKYNELMNSINIVNY